MTSIIVHNVNIALLFREGLFALPNAAAQQRSEAVTVAAHRFNCTAYTSINFHPSNRV